MREITVEKASLVSVLRTNRQKHRAIFEEALEGYKNRVIEELEKRLEDARNGRSYDITIRLLQPEDHTKDYDRILHMLEMDTGSRVTVTEQEFENYVQDEWGWTDRFLLSNSAYSSRAMAATTDRNLNTMK